MKTNAELDAAIIRMESECKPSGSAAKARFDLVPFDQLRPGNEVIYLVKGLIPRTGLVLIWGPPKCGKSFWTFDTFMHVALGWLYRGRRVLQGPVVYCAFEGASGYRARAEAFRLRFLYEHNDSIPFYLVAAKMVFLADHTALIESIRAQLGGQTPVAVVLDTLNRSIGGKEDDEHMAGYISAADAVREAFDCGVAIVHHCGVDEKRPRGHTSLTGAVDAQLAVKRDAAENIVVEVEWMKDGPEGDQIVSRLEQVEVGTDEDGEPITSCVVVPVEGGAQKDFGTLKLTRNQQTMFSMLHAARSSGLTTEEWNSQARNAGLGQSRKADLYDFREALKSKGMVRQYGDRWTVAHDD